MKNFLHTPGPHNNDQNNTSVKNNSTSPWKVEPDEEGLLSDSHECDSHTQPECFPFYRKTVHTYESRGCGDLFIWFEGTLNNSFQGPIICHPLFPTTIRLPLAPIAIEPVSNFFSLFMWALGTYCFVWMSSSVFSCTVFLYKVFEGGGGAA